MSKWFILPGMGATAAMYQSLRGELRTKVSFINWPEYRGEKSYAEVAQRIIIEHEINDDDVVGGSSLGGMVALEMASIIRPKAILLFGSAIDANEVNNLLSIISTLAAVPPISLIQALVGKQDNVASRMFAESAPEFIRAMCKYLRSWKGYCGPAENVFRLHGKRDHVIPCPSSGCDVIGDAGHLLAITHAKETASFIEKIDLHLTSQQVARTRLRIN